MYRRKISLSWLSDQSYKKISDRVYCRIFSACTFKKRTGPFREEFLLNLLCLSPVLFFSEFLKLADPRKTKNFFEKIDYGEMEFLVRSLNTLVSQNVLPEVDLIALEKDDDEVKKYKKEFIDFGRKFVKEINEKYFWPDLYLLYNDKKKLIPEKKQEFISWLGKMGFDTMKIYLWFPKYEKGTSKNQDIVNKPSKDIINNDIQGILPF